MKKKEPVTISLLKTIIRNYPVVSSYDIMTAGRSDCISGGQRLRELRESWPVSLGEYVYRNNKYNFEECGKQTIRQVLKWEKKSRGLK